MSYCKKIIMLIAGASCIVGAISPGCSDSVDKISVNGTSTRAAVVIDATLCTGCAPRYCYNSCPQRAIEELELIPGVKYVYVIDPQKCTNCGICISKCPQNAIVWKR